MSHPTLFDQGKPILMSGLALQAELESSTAGYSKSLCGEVTSTAELCSRPTPALVWVAFDAHFGFHTRTFSVHSGDASRSSSFSPAGLHRRGIRDSFLSSEDAATCCAAVG